MSKQISDDIKQFSYEICQKHKVIIRYMETDKDHIHYMIETEPTMSISKIVNLMKSYTTYHIWKRYPDYLRKHFWKEHTFWTDGYFVCSVGNVSEEMLRKYIENRGLIMFYILRHGRTDWNEEHRLQGEVDIPLNETGRQMAYDAAEKYKDIDFDICYCSPLKRAQETARIFLADRNPAVEIITDNRLHEMCFGDYEGVKNIRQKPECPVYLLFEEPEKYVAKDGAESFEELYHRTGEFIEQVLRPQLEAGKNVLVVGHGAMNCSIVNQFRGTPIKDFWKDMQGNCELLRVE